MIGLGWDPNEGQSSYEFDLDASIFMLDANGKVTKDKDLVYFRNLESICESVTHDGDNLTGGGEGDDEKIHIDLTKIPANYEKLVVVVNIYEAAKRNQNFGQVDNSFIRVVNEDDNVELAKFDLNFDASTADGVQFASLIRRNDEWYFSADAKEFSGGLKHLCAKRMV